MVGVPLLARNIECIESRQTNQELKNENIQIEKYDCVRHVSISQPIRDRGSDNDVGRFPSLSEEPERNPALCPG
jgi:hypothetical protein